MQIKKPSSYIGFLCLSPQSDKTNINQSFVPSLIHYHSLTGQAGVNQLGGVFVNGR